MVLIEDAGFGFMVSPQPLAFKLEFHEATLIQSSSSGRVEPGDANAGDGGGCGVANHVQLAVRTAHGCV